MEKYELLNQNNCYDVPTIDDKKMFTIVEVRVAIEKKSIFTSPVGKIAKKNSLKECFFVNSAPKIG